MAMMDMLLRGGFIGLGEEKLADITKGEKDVVWQKGYVVYVDFAGVVEGGEDRTEWARTVVESKGLEFVGLKAEDVFDESLSERLGGGRSAVQLQGVDLKHPGKSIRSMSPSSAHVIALPVMPQASSSLPPLEKLRNLISSLPAPSRPAMLSNILTSLLHTATSSLPNISHLLIGETATRQSQRVITATASGRGWALPLELSGSLALPNNVLRISPMKELSLKEAAFTCRTQGLETRNWRGWGKVGAGDGDKRDARGKGGAMSIEGLVERMYRIDWIAMEPADDQNLSLR
jgi:cytoplasmic tRNA 2-thiolation protein 2